MKFLFAKTLIAIGIIFVVLGTLIILADYIPWLGKLPGDIRIKREGYSFYFPVLTCIIISIILTIALNVLSRLLRR